jgi:hypothetical protein
MKNILTAILLACLCLPALAQDHVAQPGAVTHYVFPDFLPGVVKMKDGTQGHAQMNYNTLTEEMVFIKDTGRLAMINLDKIDTVYLGGKVFVPGKNMFYEKVTNTPVALYVRSKTNLLPEGKNAGYGAKSETSSVSNILSIIGASQIYQLQLPEGYKLTDHSSYWINSGDKFVQVSNLKKIQAAFPSKAEAIKNFCGQNNIRFGNMADMAKLLEFCNQPG